MNQTLIHYRLNGIILQISKDSLLHGVISVTPEEIKCDLELNDDKESLDPCKKTAIIGILSATVPLLISGALKKPMEIEFDLRLNSHSVDNQS